MIEPLTPPDCDCRGLPYMPLEVSRLLDSDFAALSTGDEFKAGVTLWAKAWSQVPAASLPDDDRILARFVGCSLADWEKLRPMALHGWVLCSDGRLYHPVIADLAIAAHAKRKGQAARANSRWAKVRSERSSIAPAMPRHEQPNAAVFESDTAACAMAMQEKEKLESKGNNPPTPLEGGSGSQALREAERPTLPESLPIEEEPRSPFKPSARRSRSGEEEGTPRPDRFPAQDLIEELQQEAREKGADISVAFHAEQFVDWVTSKGVTFIDWPAGFRRYIRKRIFEAPKVVNPPRGIDMDRIWRLRMATFQRVRSWDGDWEAPPGKPGCIVPVHILREFGFEPTSEAA